MRPLRPEDLDDEMEAMSGELEAQLEGIRQTSLVRSHGMRPRRVSRATL